MKKLLTIITIIIIITIGIIFLYPKEEQLEEVIIPPLEVKVEEEIKIEKIHVEIKGEVVTPGVYELLPESRVIDLIKLAGGLTENAVLANINQAKKLKDEMVVVIYNQNDLVEEIKTEYVYLECTCPEVKNDACIKEEVKEKEEVTEEVKDENKKVSINNATLEELMTLKGIGEKTANKIIEYRSENKFETIEDIKNVSGIGDSLYEKIKDSITI